MAFTGYNFPSPSELRKFLEPTAAGVTTSWARATAARLQCAVFVGYPETAGEDSYNSAVLVTRDGNVATNYRKTFLFTTDLSWASEGQGFFAGDVEGLGRVALGICAFPPPPVSIGSWGRLTRGKVWI